MHCRRNKFLVLCWAIGSVAILDPLSAAPLTLATTRSPRSFEGVSASLVERSLAYACLSANSLPDKMSCNPALNGTVEKPTLELRGLLSSGSSNLQTILSLSKGNVTQATIDKVFSQNQFLMESEADTELSFRSKHISLGYRPLHASGLIVARNEANPDIELRAVKSQSFFVQSSYSLLRDLNVGMRVSYAKLKGTSGRFHLTDPVLPQSRSESRLYFEPGASYDLPLAWDTRVSLMLTRLGPRMGDKITGLDAPISAEWGISISPPLYWGTLSFQLEYRDIEGGSDRSQRWRGGVLYRLGSMTTAFGVDKAGVSFGVYALLNSLGAGIVFSTNRVFWRDTSSYTQAMYSQVVWSF